VILDVVLPGVHGDELLPMIRQLLGDHVAVVAVSALGELSLVQRCIFRGADSFIVAAADPAVQPYATQPATSCIQGSNPMHLRSSLCRSSPLRSSGSSAWRAASARTHEPFALVRTLRAHPRRL